MRMSLDDLRGLLVNFLKVLLVFTFGVVDLLRKIEKLEQSGLFAVRDAKLQCGMAE